MKRAPHLLIAIPFAVLLSAQATAPPVTSLHATGFVNDFAGVIDAASKQSIESLCMQLDRKTAAQVSVVTIKTLGGEPIEDYANSLYRAWGIGRKDSKGALLLVVVQDRKTRLEIGYGLEPLLPDGFDGSVLREMRPELSQGHWGSGVQSGVRLAGAARGGEERRATRPCPVSRPSSGVPVRRSSGPGTLQIISLPLVHRDRDLLNRSAILRLWRLGRWWIRWRRRFRR
jgi:uncharacterized membrane protein YgcG